MAWRGHYGCQWHHQLVSLMSCQCSQEQLIISRSYCSSVRGTLQMGFSLHTPCGLSYWNSHTAAATLCLSLSFTSSSVWPSCLFFLSVQPLIYLFIINVLSSVMFPWFLSYLFMLTLPLLSHRQHPPGLLSPPMICPSMCQNTRTTLRSLMLVIAPMWLLS